ncbi:hypothetical protein BLA29_006084 [Euroglyphus maynei]|uniref:Uncharacterized protein n=1 Tax=Euroglyphus maynei TaxID=6958 RepID=A0A1Y3AZI1_EURMA|nr:hypothetical protein BLA29_006084 [Euroglyphus maynei]
MAENDVFVDSDGDDDELALASREYEKDLKRIENSAFHDALEETRDKLTQQSFDAGYAIAFHYFEMIGHLEGFNDVLVHTTRHQDEIHNRTKELKSRLSRLYTRLDQEFEQQMNSNVEQKLYEISETAMISNIKPSNELIDEFDHIKANIIECAKLTDRNIDEKIIDKINNLNLGNIATETTRC